MIDVVRRLEDVRQRLLSPAVVGLFEAAAPQDRESMAEA